VEAVTVAQNECCWERQQLSEQQAEKDQLAVVARVQQDQEARIAESERMNRKVHG